MRQPRRPQVAKQELVQIADGHLEVIIRRVERAKSGYSGVLPVEKFLIFLVLQSHPSSLELAVRDTPLAARVWALAAVHRDAAERAVESV